MTYQERQQLLDEEHLKLLRVGYFVAAGIDCVFAVFPLIYVAMGVALALGGIPSSGRPNEPNLAFVGVFLTLIGCAVSLFFAIAAVLKFKTGRAIGKRQSRTLCLVVAAISCVSIPWGTLLGVLTFIVLSRTSVTAMFKSGGEVVPTSPETFNCSVSSSDEMMG